MRAILFVAAILAPALGLLAGCDRKTGREEIRMRDDIEKVSRDLDKARRMEEESKKRWEEQKQLDAFHEAAGHDFQSFREERLNRKIERARFSGKWVAIALTSDGAEIPAAVLEKKPRSWTIDDGKILSKRPGNGATTHEEEINFDVDLSATPNAIDLDYQPSRERYRGIYALDGDTLKICSAMNPDGPRPTDFTAGKDSKRTLTVWKRVKE